MTGQIQEEKLNLLIFKNLYLKLKNFLPKLIKINLLRIEKNNLKRKSNLKNW